MEEHMEVNELDFLPDLSQNRTNLPDELPMPVLRDRLPSELLRSSTIESLISQNEDLMARLKVTLRRLSLLESENQRLSSENQKEKQSASASLDQLLVMKEKDQLWKNKIDDLEKTNELIQDKLVNIQNAYQVSKSQAERLEKYHDRVRNHVKPFVQELKKYSKSLEARLTDLQESLHKKEAQISDANQQIIEITKNSKYQIENLKKKSWEQTEHFEQLNHQLVQESQQLKELNTSLSEKIERLKYFQERADQLENENIELRRRLEASGDRHQADLNAIESKFQAQSSELSTLKVEHHDAKDRLLEEFEHRKQLEKQVFDLRHQLDSLRYMWTAKNDENERLRQSLAALEKLNVDLSAKLQEIRVPEEVSPEA
jgi:chromosome segregation ATPase